MSAWPAREQGGLGQGCRSTGNLSPAGPIAFCTSYPWWVSLALPALPDTPGTSGTDCDHLDVSPAQMSLFRRLHGASAGGALKMALGGCSAHCSDAHPGRGLLGILPGVAAGGTHGSGSSGVGRSLQARGGV